MIKALLICALFILLASSLKTQVVHEQFLPTPKPNPSNNNSGLRQPSNPVPGDPFGRDTNTKATCFNAPCL